MRRFIFAFCVLTLVLLGAGLPAYAQTPQPTGQAELVATRLHIILEPAENGSVQISLWYVIENPSTQAVVAAAPDQPVLRFSVPQGSTNLQFTEMTDTSTLLPTMDGFGDTASVPPGSDYQMFYMVEMNYQDQNEFALPLHLPVGQAIIMLPAGSIEISGAGLIDNGQRTMNDGVNLQIYTTAAIPAEGTLRFNFQKPQQVSTALIGGLAFGVALIGAGSWWFVSRRRRSRAAVSEEPAPEIDELLDSIVALDDLYQAGEIGETAYQQRRAELKERARLLREKNG